MSNVYFGDIEQEAIEEYLFSNIPETKKTYLFNHIIDPAVKKITSHYAYKIYNLEDIDVLKDELYSHCMYALHNFYNPVKGKAYSYLTYISRTHALAYIKKYSRQTSQNYKWYLQDNEISNADNDADSNIEKNEFMTHVIYSLSKLEFRKEVDRILLDGVLRIIQDRELLVLENKKKVIFLLHEMTAVETKVISSFLLKLGKSYIEIKDEFYETGATAQTAIRGIIQ